MTSRTRKEARDCITHHLSKYSNRSVELTERTVVYWWNMLNTAIFSEELNRPEKFVINNYFHSVDEHTMIAMCAPGDVDLDKVIIKLIRQMKRREFLTVLVHEMVHQWEWENFNSMGHGERFKSWKETINDAIGLTLSEYVNDQEL